MIRATFSVVIAGETPTARLTSAKDSLASALGVKPELIDVTISPDIYVEDVSYIAVPER